MENDLMCPGAGATVLLLPSPAKPRSSGDGALCNPSFLHTPVACLVPGPGIGMGGKQISCPHHSGESGAPPQETVLADYCGVSDRAMGGGSDAGRGRKGLAARWRSFLCRVRPRRPDLSCRSSRQWLGHLRSSDPQRPEPGPASELEAEGWASPSLRSQRQGLLPTFRGTQRPAVRTLETAPSHCCSGLALRLACAVGLTFALLCMFWGAAGRRGSAAWRLCALPSPCSSLLCPCPILVQAGQPPMGGAAPSSIIFPGWG